MRRYVLAATSAALAAATLFAGTALAQPAGDPVSGDDRATAHAGNVVAKDCATLFPGSTALASSNFGFSVDDTNTYIDITGIAEGVALVGVIVKGGPAYNVYEPGDLGSMPWLDLHSPLVSSGKPAQISHWFACGSGGSESTPPMTTTTDETTTSSETSATETTSESSGSTSTRETESSSGGVAVTPTTTTSVDVAATASDEDLASTGFNGGWLVALGALLLLGGAALLVVLRLRAARR